jgi:hypothetical protein
MAILFKMDGTEETVTINGLDDMQSAVGGLIEVARDEGTFALLVNEEGYMMNMQPNPAFPEFVGPVLRVAQPSEFN